MYSIFTIYAYVKPSFEKEVYEYVTLKYKLRHKIYISKQYIKTIIAFYEVSRVSSARVILIKI